MVHTTDPRIQRLESTLKDLGFEPAGEWWINDGFWFGCKLTGHGSSAHITGDMIGATVFLGDDVDISVPVLTLLQRRSGWDVVWR